jgi:hypothetical protein
MCTNGTKNWSAAIQTTAAAIRIAAVTSAAASGFIDIQNKAAKIGE